MNDPFDESWSALAGGYAFILCDDGKYLHQQWTSSQGKSEWRRVPTILPKVGENVTKEYPTSGWDQEK